MSDLTGVFGGKAFSIEDQPIDSPEQQFINAIRKTSVLPPDGIIFDGNIHRYNNGTSESNRSKSGWYIAYDDGFPAGSFGCWRLGFSETWAGDIGRPLTPDELAARQIKMAELKAVREAERAEMYNHAAVEAKEIWAEAKDADATHFYLKKKKILPHGSKIAKDGRLIVPLLDETGDLRSLLYISGDSTKIYLTHGQAKGMFWMIGTLDDPGVLYIAEGFATAATIYEVTNRPCVVAFSAHNLPIVTRHVRDLVGPDQDIVIVADNDEKGTGANMADKASRENNTRMKICPLGDANDYHLSGGDLKEFLFESKSDLFGWVSFADVKPIPWLIKKWIPRGGVGMIFGESGVGKTFIAVDIACSIATGKQWQGFKTRPGKVAYMAGEGYIGMSNRIMAWAHLHECPESELKKSLMVSRRPVTLDGPGIAADTLWQIRQMTADPISLIVLDTLNRHMGGEENNQRDIRSLMNACGVVAEATGAAVLIVHHTGHGGDAKGRERGASAIRASLDVSILVTQKTEDKEEKKTFVIAECVKMKDAAKPAPVQFELIEIDLGLIDEDGELDAPSFAAQWCDLELATDKTVENLLKPKDKKQQKLDDQRDLGYETYLASAGVKGRLSDAGLFDGLHLEDWRQEYYSRFPDEKQGTKRQWFNRMKADLLELGSIRFEGCFYYPNGGNSGEFFESLAEMLKSDPQ